MLNLRQPSISSRHAAESNTTPAVMTIVRVLFSINTLLTGIITGTLWCILVGLNPVHFSYSTYVEQQQRMILSFNTLMPVLGLIAILLTITLAFLCRDSPSQVVTLVLAALCLTASGIITRFCNQPINDIVMGWSPDEPAPQWAFFRDQWRAFHAWRTWASFFAFCLIVRAVTTRTIWKHE
jgi:uncharacterized membrane protein